MKYYIGIDNGVTATIAIIKPNGEVFMSKVPVKTEQSYTKAKQKITRIDHPKLIDLLRDHVGDAKNVFVRIERPIVNPGRFKATASGLRALESVLIAVEDVMNLPYSYIDSKEWQKDLLPSGIKGDELKAASKEIGSRLFPQFKDFKHPDLDGLLIAEYCRRKQL